MYVCMYVCMYVWMYVCMYVYVIYKIIQYKCHTQHSTISSKMQLLLGNSQSSQHRQFGEVSCPAVEVEHVA